MAPRESKTMTDAADEERRSAPFGYITEREDFVALYPHSNDFWLASAWPAYQAKVAFIQAAYDDEATRKRLYAHIHPKRWSWDKDFCWLDEQDHGEGGVESILVAAAGQSGHDPIFDTIRDYVPDDPVEKAWREAPVGIAAYLAAPQEFQTRKADAFFARYALEAGAHLSDAHFAKTGSATKSRNRFLHIFHAAQMALAGGLIYVNLVVWQGPWWINLIGALFIAEALFVTLFNIVRNLVTFPKRRRVRTAFHAATNSCRMLAKELRSQSFDAGTILARLQAVEAGGLLQFPTYLHVLLKRLDGAASYGGAAQ